MADQEILGALIAIIILLLFVFLLLSLMNL